MHSHGPGGHHHHATTFGKAFVFGIVLNAIFVVAEVVFGFRAHSMALLADAGHNVSDVLGLFLAWSATWLSIRPATQSHTYGLRSTSILAALGNALLLLVATGAVAWEAIRRLAAPEQVSGSLVVLIAGCGIVVNGIVTLLFARGAKGDLNIRAAFAHMLADTLIAAAVLIGGLVIVYTHKELIDPLLSLIIVGVILYGTWGLFKEALNYALQAVPPGVQLSLVRECLENLDGVHEVHDLHVWGLSTSEIALTAHLVAPDVESADALIAAACKELHDRFEIHHVTLQVERGSFEHECVIDCGG